MGKQVGVDGDPAPQTPGKIERFAKRAPGSLRENFTLARDRAEADEAVPERSKRQGHMVLAGEDHRPAESNFDSLEGPDLIVRAHFNCRRMA